MLPLPEASSIVAVLSPKDTRLSLLRLTNNSHYPKAGAVDLQTIVCPDCQQLHVAPRCQEAVPAGTALSIALPTDAPVLLVQFDGSCHSYAGAGGAGLAALQITAGPSSLTHWRSVAIPQCADNILAEAWACKEALHLAIELQRLLPSRFSKIFIQGNILPLINYMNHKGRIRRLEAAQIMEDCQLLASQLSPFVHFIYLPRECNSLADYFAGPSRWADKPPCSSSIWYPTTTWLYKVDHSSLDITLTLSERPRFSWTALTDYLPGHPQHVAAWQTYRERFLKDALIVHYRPSLNSPEGRLYAIESAAQTIPRSLRAILFGSTHCELDITGAHYEIIRRLACQLYWSTSHHRITCLASHAARPANWSITTNRCGKTLAISCHQFTKP